MCAVREAAAGRVQMEFESVAGLVQQLSGSSGWPDSSDMSDAACRPMCYRVLGFGAKWWGAPRPVQDCHQMCAVREAAAGRVQMEFESVAGLVQQLSGSSGWPDSSDMSDAACRPMCYRVLGFGAKCKDGPRGDWLCCKAG